MNIHKPNQTPLTRIAAGAAAIIVIIGLVFYAFPACIGNSIPASTHKIVDYFETEHPGEGYVVGPAQYMYSDGKSRIVVETLKNLIKNSLFFCHKNGII